MARAGGRWHGAAHPWGVQRDLARSWMGWEKPRGAAERAAHRPFPTLLSGRGDTWTMLPGGEGC